MKEKIRENYLCVIITALLFILMVVFHILLFTSPKEAIGPGGLEVGMPEINEKVFDWLGASKTFDLFSDGLLVIAILVCAFFFFLGVYRLIRYKKLDKSILLMGIFYIILGIIYFIFEKIVINYAPILKYGEPKPSYPSSHVLLSTFVFLSAIVIIDENLEKKIYKNVLIYLSVALVVLMFITRLLSGNHWLSDTIGGLLIGSFLASLYSLINTLFFKKDIKNEN